MAKIYLMKPTGDAEKMARPPFCRTVEATIADDGTVLDGHHRITALREMGTLLVEIDGRYYDISEWPTGSQS